VLELKDVDLVRSGRRVRHDKLDDLQLDLGVVEARRLEVALAQRPLVSIELALVVEPLDGQL